MDTLPKYQRLSADERRDQLLDVANALLAERGYEEVTVEHIAKAARRAVTRTSLKGHKFADDPRRRVASRAYLTSPSRKRERC